MDKVNMVPGFILKLWKMINDPQCDDLISWSENGQSFIIMDPPKFSQELSKYFKHNNLSSFIRQLNMYGFRKVATIENSGLHPGTDDLHFYHPDFVRGKPERLEAIKRKLPQKLSESVDLRNVIKGITEIEDKQKDVTKSLSELKRENEMLWAELHDLRQKHQQQQLYISRLMKLVFEAMEQNGIKTNMLQLKRDSPLMIEGGEETHQVKRTRLLSPEEISAPNMFDASAVIVSTPSPVAVSAVPVAEQVTAPMTSPIETIPTTSFQVSTIPLIPQTVDQLQPNPEVPIDVSNYDARNIEENINSNEGQLDQLLPTLVDYDENQDFNENLDANIDENLHEKFDYSYFE